MRPAKSTNEFKLRRHRHGVCHRCGWSGSVVRVSRRKRWALLRMNQVYRRLCDECVDDLVREQRSSQDGRATGTRMSKVTGDLDVA